VKKVQLYTRVGCHLCEVVEAELENLKKEIPFEIELLDIDRDEKLRELYNEEVPVVMLDGKKIAKYHLDVEMLRRRL
jgi:glutaredoxin